jgi:hypothetical protein
LTNPEDEYGITSYDDFKSIIGNSQSFALETLLKDEKDINGNIIKYKDYDIIWVDWNNGTDFIQKNAYVLEEVIKWVNEEKLANGSSQSNIVLGASMGGLIARFALKDMEDRGTTPTQTSLYVSFDAPHQGANFPVGYQYMSRHALHQYVQSPLLLLGGQVVMPLFTDGVTPLDYLFLQNTPAARQMLINYVGINYGITNTVHDDWQNELRLKGYPSMRKIAISNGNHCAIPQNAPAGNSLLSVNGNYSTGWFTDIVLTTFPMVNATIFKSLAVLTAEPGFLVGILPGGNKIKLDFKINSLPSAGTNEVYKGKITYTKKLLWLVNINVTITDKSFSSPSNTLPFDYYPGGAIETGIRNSSTASGGSFWQQAFVKYKMTVATEPSFCFIPAASALDIGLGNVILNNDDYLKKYNKATPLVSPKVSPFDNFTTSFQNSFTLNTDDFFQSTNEHHIYLHLRNANWLAREIDNVPNNNQVFDCSYICSNTSITGADFLCTTSNYTAPAGGVSYNWTITQGANLVSLTGNGTSNVTLAVLPNASGTVTLLLTLGGNCGNVTLDKTILVGVPQITGFICPNNSTICSGTFCKQELGLPSFDLTNNLEANVMGMTTTEMWEKTNWEWERINTNIVIAQNTQGNEIYVAPNYIGQTGVRVRAKNSCGWSEWGELYFEIVNCNINFSRLSEQDKVFIVYPNPSNDVVNIDVKEGNSILAVDTKVSGELFDMMGNSKSKIKIKNKKASFNVNGLNKGVYVLKIYMDDKTESHQIGIK